LNLIVNGIELQALYAINTLLEYIINNKEGVDYMLNYVKMKIKFYKICPIYIYFCPNV